MELVPQPLAHLIRRAERERKLHGAVFDLPLAKTWRGTPAGLDFSRGFHGERAATPVGPAAGPHTQLAQNIALSYLSGSRILELKTVQILDELAIPRPCIDVENIGFNVEWSQELKIEQSTLEYPKAALLVAALQRMGLPEGLPAKDQPYLLDLSVGYDLKGIQTERVTGFIRRMMDASPVIDELLDGLPADLAAYRDLRPDPSLVSCVTLSTFHGCPAGEIELIARYLLEELGVHTVVKLNPTLLGFQDVQSILHDQLGYKDLHVDRASFDHDLQWNDALAMIERLRAVAHRQERVFGVKLTNTLVVNNHKSFFPASEKSMYLSGQPLHVLSTQLLERLRRAVPAVGPGGEPPVEYSFSAGIDQHNFPLAVAADLCPVTTCTDLLRPGGYARLPKYLDALAAQMKKVGATDLPTFIVKAHGAQAESCEEARASIERAAGLRGLAADDLSARLASAAARLTDSDLTSAIGTSFDGELAEVVHTHWVHAAGTRGAAEAARASLADPRYRQDKNAKSPKKIGSKLELFDCINCDKCVPVCPNDANFAYEVAPLTMEAPTWLFDGDAVSEGPSIKVDVEKSHQLATFVDFCNGCGNCDIFCPEDGGPYHMKPHWFGSRSSLEAEKHLDGFYVESREVIAGRWRGRFVRLELADNGELEFEDGTVRLRAKVMDSKIELLSHARIGADGAHKVDAGELLVLRTLLTGVLATVNPVSAAI